MKQCIMTLSMHDFVELHISVANLTYKTALLFTILEHKLQPATKCKHIVPDLLAQPACFAPTNPLYILSCNIFFVLSE